MFNISKDEDGRYFTKIAYHEKYWLPLWSTYSTYKQPIRSYIVAWLIIFAEWWPKYFSNNGAFKKGDKVKYNWKAKAHINSVVKSKPEVKTVLKHLYSDKSNVQFYGGDSCASFWLRKLYFWELWKQK